MLPLKEHIWTFPNISQEIESVQNKKFDKTKETIKWKIGIFHCMPVANRVTVKYARK